MLAVPEPPPDGHPAWAITPRATGTPSARAIPGPAPGKTGDLARRIFQQIVEIRLKSINLDIHPR
jgi:hypothetical protein